MNLNKVILVGRLTREPELRKLPSGKSVCDNVVCVDERRKLNDEWQDVPNFIDVTFFGKTAETVYTYLHKGDIVLVDGNLRQDKWETETGEKRSRLIVVCQRMEMLPKSMSVASQRENQTQNEQPIETSENSDSAPF